MAILEESRIYTLLKQYNPWWENADHRLRVPDARREAFGECLHVLERNHPRRFAVLSGARRVGKTTVMRQLINHLLEQGVPPRNILYLSFDNPLCLLAGFEQILSTYNSLEHSPHCYFFFDEVQYAAQWSLWVKYLYDQFPDVKLVATGSASPVLEKGAADSGVGRWQILHMPTMSFREFCALQQDFSLPTAPLPTLETLHELTDAQFRSLMLPYSNIEPAWRRYIERGGFPESMAAEDAEEARLLLRESIAEMVLKRDIPALFEVRDPLQMEKLFLYICLHSGDLFNLSAVCQELEGLTRPTLSRYIGYLQDANLVYISPVAAGSGKKRLSAQPKIYVADAALRNACLMLGDPFESADEMGTVAETTLYKHFYDAYRGRAQVGYLRLPGRSNKEVDIVVDNPVGTRMLCEVKYRNDTTLPKDAAILQLCREKAAATALLATKRISDFGITREGDSLPLYSIPAPILCLMLP